MADLMSKNLSLLSIPAVWLTVAFPVALKNITLQNTKGFKFDNVQPRENASRLASAENIPKDLPARIRRMEGAHVNGNENLPLWIGAVLAGNLVGLEHATLNKVAIFYIVGRSLYNYVYINHTTGPQSVLRTAIWWITFSGPMYLLIKAGLKAAS
ncbi:hypothetical protein PILCRDRAFT_816663 [Piloderma croceum F 1598]|uniref:Uncharacterized protein n=1 Tax=Piloderma croceum (strain F 1598) TaxID=765440 RepID=A0A0C3G667_PILCF|nr:hypothetical protein PILCRDRAFT_816663 [Piloderma croceum F 1598]